jgi:hypothetical protein
MTDRRVLCEPRPADPDCRRYGHEPFPPYRFVPGLNPHPARDPGGHSHEKRETACAPWNEENWQDLAAYLEAADLFNYAYWWESHERLEPLWIAAGKTSREAIFVQGLIKVAAACLNKHVGKNAVAARQASDGVAQITSAAGSDLRFMGLDSFAFALETRAWFEDRAPQPPLIRLD